MGRTQRQASGILEQRHKSWPNLCPDPVCWVHHLAMHAQVCWNSAKVQLNSGILERRHKNWPKALDHFQLARTLEPGYCEPDYWVGATMINAGMDVDTGLKVCCMPGARAVSRQPLQQSTDARGRPAHCLQEQRLSCAHHRADTGAGLAELQQAQTAVVSSGAMHDRGDSCCAGAGKGCGLQVCGSGCSNCAPSGVLLALLQADGNAPGCNGHGSSPYACELHMGLEAAMMAVQCMVTAGTCLLQRAQLHQALPCIQLQLAKTLQLCYCTEHCRTCCSSCGWLRHAPMRHHQAITALQAFQQLQAAARPDDPRVRQRWARLLLKPGLKKLADACELLLLAGTSQLKAQGQQARPGWPSIEGKLALWWSDLIVSDPNRA